MNPDVTISDEMKKMMSECSPGQEKEMSVKVSVGKDGKITVSPMTKAQERAEEAREAKPKKKMTGRPKPVMSAISEMYG